MNSSYYSNQVITKLQNLIDNGLPVSNTDLTTVATNSTDISSDTSYIEDHTSKIAACVDNVNHHLEVDTNAINGVLMSVNSGVVGDGVQRVCIADDDNNLSQIATYTQRTTQTIYDADFTSQNTNTVYLGQQLINLGSGNTSTGTQRITLANDDTLKGPVHTLGTLTDLYTPGTTKGFIIGGAQLDSKFAPITLTNTGNPACDIVKIQGTNTSVSSGNKDNGCQRVCIATDDINIASISSKCSSLSNSTITFGTSAKVLGIGTKDSATNGCCSLGVGIARQDFA